jgi:hypothetical protein
VAQPVRRLGVVYVPNGIVMSHWTPAAEGTAFDLMPTMEPLAPFRNQMNVLTGLNGVRGGGAHAGATTRFLSGVVSKDATEYTVHAGVSMDQLVARHFGEHTQLASLELATEGREVSGSCDPGKACVYTNTIAWRTETTPLPMETSPRAVFERLFGDGGSTDPAARRARLETERSVLDSVTSKIANLQRGLGPHDRRRVDEYLEAVRDVERRIQKTEEQMTRELPVVEQPIGVPTSFPEHVKTMFDLQVLAYQCDLTRVITFMMGREFSGRTYPEIGVPYAHHPTSHHMNEPEKLEMLTKINRYHVNLFSYYLEKLRSTPDGDGSLLDHLLLLYGAGMSDSNAHDPNNLPVLLVGGASGRLKGNHHVKYAGDRMANFLVTMMDLLDVPVDRLGNSDGKIELSRLSLA